jgi:hypothetical protein
MTYRGSSHVPQPFDVSADVAEEPRDESTQSGTTKRDRDYPTPSLILSSERERVNNRQLIRLQPFQRHASRPHRETFDVEVYIKIDMYALMLIRFSVSYSSLSLERQ